jgi:hypothetical protein
MTVTTTEDTRSELQLVALDLYKDIHKGIRSELFELTVTAGRLDPSRSEDRAALAGHLGAVVSLLIDHAEHEDGAVQPSIEEHLPALAERIAADHDALEARMVTLQEMADAAVGAAPARQQADIHRLYLELGSFTGAYLAHQDLEECVVMPALDRAIGVEAVAAIHGAIIAGIPPGEMARALSVMFPAMNVDDRTALLEGTRANAPAEAFEANWGLARSVLATDDVAALASRLGLA